MYQHNRWQLLADYNRWMNQRLFETCAGVPDGERKRDRGAFFRSIHSTLNHILWGDQAWMARFTGMPGPATAVGEDLFEDFSELRTAREAMDMRIVEWAGALTEAWLQTPLAYQSRIYGVTRSQPAWIYVTHLFNHQSHHRGQVTTLLSQLGIDPGITDIPMMPGLE
jgi:uncharacterized damage-inducible protein DinB